MNTNTAEELFSSSLNYIVLDKDSIKEAQTRFLAYQEAGVIKSNCNFEDKVWYMTDEYSNVGLHFDFNTFSYNQYKPIFNMDLSQFITYVKVFLVSILGRNALQTLQSVLLDIRRIISADIGTIYNINTDFKVAVPSLCSDFFAMLPDTCDNVEIEKLIDAMDFYADMNFASTQQQQRSLADFDTYFIFNDIIKDYWTSSLSDEERLFYYPLYIWWTLTAALPLRPREFLLTQRDCLYKDKAGDYYLKLRRNQLKGGNRGISYKLSEDYVVNTYKIPTYLGDEIQRYITLTEKYSHTDINTLFVTDTHYRKWGQSKHSDSRYLTYVNMNTILKYFYREIICARYGLKIVYDYTSEHLNDGEIRYIHLGDTRHIALINIMQEGGTPTTAMFLAGHTNDVMAAHYYSNLTRLIECKTYRQYRKLISGDTKYQISVASMLPETGNGYILSDGGKCYSKAYQDGDISDCCNTVGENGEIGYCPACTYYRRPGISYFAYDDIYKSHINEDCTALANAIELVRQGKGDIEDIGEAFLKIHSSSVSYGTYLMEKHTAENQE